MHIPTLSALLLTLGAAISSPITNTTTTESTTALHRRSNSCTSSYEQMVASRWNIHLDNDDYYNKRCGNGCLDNIRGRCSIVSDWACSRDDAGNAFMNFTTPSGCSHWAMTQALKACTKGEQTIDCVFA